MGIKLSRNYASSLDAVSEFNWKPKKKRFSPKIEEILSSKASED